MVIDVLADMWAGSVIDMIVEVLVIDVRTVEVIGVLTDVVIDVVVDMLVSMEIIVLVAAVMTLEFATTISCAVDMLADACAGVCAGANTRVVSGMRVDVLEAMMTVWELTLSVPIEEPACFC